MGDSSDGRGACRRADNSRRSLQRTSSRDCRESSHTGTCFDDILVCCPELHSLVPRNLCILLGMDNSFKRMRMHGLALTFLQAIRGCRINSLTCQGVWHLQDDWEEVTFELLQEAWRTYVSQLPGGLGVDQVLARRWLEAIRGQSQ